MTWQCYGVVGTTGFMCMNFADDYVPAEGSVLMTQVWPGMPGPTRFGEWYVQADGTFTWHVYPDPPFNVVYHEGKLKNADTMVEIAIETLPGNVAARLTTLETLLPSPPTPPTP